MTNERDIPESGDANTTDWDAALAELTNAHDPSVEFWLEENRRAVLAATREDVLARYLEFFQNGLDLDAYAMVLAARCGIDVDDSIDCRSILDHELDRIIMKIAESQVGPMDETTLMRAKYNLAAELIAKYESMVARPLIDMIDLVNSGACAVGQQTSEVIIGTDEQLSGTNAIREHYYSQIWRPMEHELLSLATCELEHRLGSRDDLAQYAATIVGGSIAVATAMWEMGQASDQAVREQKRTVFEHVWTSYAEALNACLRTDNNNPALLDICYEITLMIGARLNQKFAEQIEP